MDQSQGSEPTTDDIAGARPTAAPAATTEQPSAARLAPDEQAATQPAAAERPMAPPPTAEPPGAEERPTSPEDARPDDRSGVTAPEAEQSVEPTEGPIEDRIEGRTDAPLLPDEQGEQLRSRWREIQTRFVDDPREAVAAADGLVAELMQTLASGFADRRHALEGQWQRGEEVGTEDLRVVLQQYRVFFDRLLSA
jgi:hypothetical protein